MRDHDVVVSLFLPHNRVQWSYCHSVAPWIVQCLVEVYLLAKGQPLHIITYRKKLLYLSSVRSTLCGDIVSEVESFRDLIVEHECGDACHRVGKCPTQTLWRSRR